MRRFLPLVIVLFLVSTAFAADVKISALTAASGANLADEYAANQAGTTRKVTLTQIADKAAITIVTGATVTAGNAETWHTLTANCAQNITTTVATCMTTNTLAAGTWQFEYTIIWQSAATTTGINFQIAAGGTVTRFRAICMHGTTSTGTANGNSDLVNTTNTGQIVEFQATRTSGGSMGPTAGVDTINADELMFCRGSVVTSTSGDLQLKAASEIAASGITVMADTNLRLRRLN